MNKKTKLELTWPGKEERPKLEPRILIEDADKSYGAEGSGGKEGPGTFDNILIKGDNLLALKALESEPSIRGLVKCAYIDPPYNIKVASPHYTDGMENSEWLTMMKGRLELLWKLIDDDGFLFVQIDDEQFARLYLLMGEICGHQNLKSIVVKMSEASGVKMAPVRRLGLIPKYKEFVIAAGKSGIRNVRPEYIPKGSWDNEYNIWIEGFTEGDRENLDRLIGDEGQEEQRLTEIDSILASWETRTVASVLREKDIPDDRKEEFLFENAWRIIRTAASSSVFRLANEKKRACSQRFFGVCSTRDKNMYIVKSDYGNDSKSPRVQCLFASDNLKIHPGDIWTDINTTGLEAEGGVEFKNGKKPEALLQRLIGMVTSPGDLVLDSFAGSGTTGAVAQKMGRRWIMVEIGDHADTHIVPRLKKVIDGTDQGGISKAMEWQGGGGFRYYTLAPSLLSKDKWGNWVVAKEYDPNMLAAAMCKHLGFTYAPSEDEGEWWRHGQSSETDFIYVTTQSLTRDALKLLSDEVGEERSLMICAPAFSGSFDDFENLSCTKIPSAILSRCEWGRDDYSLNVSEAPADEAVEADEAEDADA